MSQLYSHFKLENHEGSDVMNAFVRHKYGRQDKN